MGWNRFLRSKERERIRLGSLVAAENEDQELRTVKEQIGEQVEGKLAVVEEETAFLVVRVADPEDWLVRFEKSPDFDAREWAANMVHVYNRRLSHPSVAPSTPPSVQPASYEPN